eukprot:scaffold400564_cov48-Prasinocladus_malaysianus.AAC.1
MSILLAKSHRENVDCRPYGTPPCVDVVHVRLRLSTCTGTGGSRADERLQVPTNQSASSPIKMRRPQQRKPRARLRRCTNA